MRKGVFYTSYFKKIDSGKGIKICIARVIPKWIDKTLFDHFYKELAPSGKLLADWKTNKITWNEYTWRYVYDLYNMPNSIRTFNIVKDYLDRGIDVTVYCYEKEFPCHRFILSHILRQSGYEAQEIR